MDVTSLAVAERHLEVPVEDDALNLQQLVLVAVKEGFDSVISGIWTMIKEKADVEHCQLIEASLMVKFLLTLDLVALVGAGIEVEYGLAE
ncbi:hypothetical protein BHM03_00038536 [Ensete ventricosum]|nr:hypothetical protein BHM03_00038536 [Ensete ventricosum]